MAFFQKRGSITKTDPFLDALISYTSNENISYYGVHAIKNSDIFTAVKIIASDIATNPIRIKQNGIELENTDLNYLLNVKPNNITTAFHFKFALAANMLLNGNSYARIIRDKNGQPLQLDFIPVSQMTGETDGKSITYKYVLDNGETLELAQEDVLHFKYFTVDGLEGISPLYALQKETAMIDAGNNTLLNFFKQGVNGSGILEINQSNLNSDAKKIIREKFEEANAGDANAQRTIILDSTMKYTPIEVNTEVLNLVNNNVYSTKQIAKAFGIPLERFGMELVNTSTEDANIAYLQGTLSHYFKVFTNELNVKLLEYPMNAMQEFSFNTDQMLQVSMEKLIELLTTGVQSSLLTINEARRKLGYGPVEGGDVILASLNYANLNAVKDGEKNE